MLDGFVDLYGVIGPLSIFLPSDVALIHFGIYFIGLVEVCP